ncbi:metal ABC transporter solute-binding protein, Zn/Mn family [Litchfieldia alkalitelluris]|uniref:metal ABC transporter solute-binding protein, Zn/Mn family n=1 Tax=Litchfieldia alkalitelluris TaxID=304268 RepID=UPI0009961417|nr:zinc ABC transporter substrate-binding protein [Litchfieldia alkalitelluris]
MKLKALIFSLILIISLFLSGCSGEQTSKTDEKIKIYTTIYPLEYFAERIGGGYVSVESVIPPGSDAHSFEPTPKTMTQIAEAAGFIYSGVGLESFVDSAKETLKNEKVTFIEASAGIELIANEDGEHAHEEEEHHADDEHAHEEEEQHADDEHAHEEEEHHVDDEHAHEEEEHHVDDEHAHEEEEHHVDDEHAHEEEEQHADDEHAHEEEEQHADDEHAHEEEESTEDEHDHGDEDPHVWIDPILSITLAENIKNELIKLAPEFEESFETNYLELKTELETLNQEFKQVVDEAQNKEILVSHAAYGYWENRYGIHQISVSGLSPTQEPSQKQLQTIIETAKEHEIKYVIFEQNITGKVSEVVQKEIGAEALTLHNLESLTEDEIKDNEDYFSIMRKNIETLKKAMN